MDRIGYICDIKEKTPNMRFKSNARMLRGVALTNALREKDLKLFIFSWYHLNPETKMVAGYYIIDGKFVPTVEPIPKINGYWQRRDPTYRDTRINQLSHATFKGWLKQNNIQVYPPRELGRLTIDKWRSYRFLQPQKVFQQAFTELFQNEKPQWEKFFAMADKIFLKPRKGSLGYEIVVVTKEAAGFSLLYYGFNGTQVKHMKTLGNVIKQVSAFMINQSYIIQVGISVEKFRDSPFIIRAILVSNGEIWHWSHKVVQAQPGSDIANTEQDGINFITEDVLQELYEQHAADMLEKLKIAAFSLAAQLESEYASSVPELAIDFILDKQQQVYVSEIDVSPGLIKPGMDPKRPFKDIFHLTSAEQVIFDKYYVPYAQDLADFFVKKLRMQCFRKNVTIPHIAENPL
jgi:glutathione synthase/RimK-type ligase-like ATP-grasp enzyme